MDTWKRSLVRVKLRSRYKPIGGHKAVCCQSWSQTWINGRFASGGESAVKSVPVRLLWLLSLEIKGVVESCFFESEFFEFRHAVRDGFCSSPISDWVHTLKKCKQSMNLDKCRAY